jgi:hypothetical protein
MAMKPQFGEVLDFVRDGEDDPGLETRLRDDPDGLELLRQARLVCALLGDRRPPPDLAESWPDAGFVLEEAELGDDIIEVRDVEMPIEAIIKAPLMGGEAADFRRSDRAMRVSETVRGRDRSRESLGELKLGQRAGKLWLTFEPGAAAGDRLAAADGTPDLFERDAGLRIPASNVDLFLPDAVTVDEDIGIRLIRRRDNRPAQGIEMVFMPDEGPFVRLESDEDGRASLPARSGMLRIEDRPPQLLRVIRD